MSTKTESQNPTTEQEALKLIADQVDNFVTALGEKADTQEVATLKESIDTLSKSIEDLTGAQVLESIKKINEQNEKLYQQVVKMQEEAAEAAEKTTPGTKASKSIVSDAEIEAFAKTLFPEGKRSENTRKEVRVEVKAAEEFGFNSFEAGADISAITGRMVDPTLYQRRRKTNIILDYFDIKTINVPTLIYLRKIDVGVAPDTENSGAAAWIACGDPKPRRSFRITTGTAEAKKVSIFNTIDDCLLQDAPSFVRWVREDFIDEMKEAINSGLLNGDPDVNEHQPTGLRKNAVLFSATPAFNKTVANPTYIDAIIAIAALFAVNKEKAAAVFVASDVFYAIHALKSTDQRYLNNNLVYTNNLGQLFIAGVEVVPVDNEDVPSTHVLAIGADLGFKIYAYGNMVIETGLNGEDFRNDKTSIRGWQRFLSFIPEDRENSVLYDTWANILAAIAKV